MGQKIFEAFIIAVGLSFAAGLTIRPKGSVAVIGALTDLPKYAIRGAGGQYTRVGNG